MNLPFWESWMGFSGIRLYVYNLGQDDPKKCTSAKLYRLGFVKQLKWKSEVPKKAVLLNPFSSRILLPSDRSYAANHGVVAVDCSWKKVDEVFARKFGGENRRLPLLVPVNPINYGHTGMLSSLEAIAATLYITGFREYAERILKIFNWAPNFLTLNMERLENYSQEKTMDGILRLEKVYFPNL